MAEQEDGRNVVSVFEMGMEFLHRAELPKIATKQTALKNSK